MTTTTKLVIAGVATLGIILLLRRSSSAAADPKRGTVLTELVVAKDKNGCGCFQHVHDTSSGSLSVDRVPRSQCDNDPALNEQLGLCDAGDEDFVPVDSGGFPVGSFVLPDIVTAFGRDVKNMLTKLVG